MIKTLAFGLLFVAAPHAPADEDVLTPFASDTTWEVYDADPAAGPANLLGLAQLVCLSPSVPASCPGGATAYCTSHPGGWTANLASIPGAGWIWAPGITGATQPAELAEFYFVKQFVLGTPTAGTLSVAVDDFAEIRVNGVVVGTHGSTTDVGMASAAQSGLGTFDLTPFLASGLNTLTVRAQNGIGSFAGCTNCTYCQHTAGVVFGGTLDSVSVSVPASSFPALALGILVLAGLGVLLTVRRSARSAS